MVTFTTAPSAHNPIARDRGKWCHLGLLALAEVLGMSLWFSASAVSPALQVEWGLSVASSAWLTMAVQIGFVLGAFLSGVFNLPDIIGGRRLFVTSSILGAVANASFALFATGLLSGIGFRFLTGVCLAGIYPPGMKLASTWTQRHRGLALSLVVGALTLGSALPHLIRSMESISWSTVILVSSVLSLLGGLIIALIFREGPFRNSRARFNPRFAFSIFANRGMRLANFGYLGHQWELYAMWTWVPIFLAERLVSRVDSATLVPLLAFAVVGIGGVGSVMAGVFADRVGRTATTSVAMIISGSAALLTALFHTAPLPVLSAILMLWGFSVVADSAQFSASITELSPPEYIGTALTIQTSIGFLVTMVSIQLVPFVVAVIGWSGAFVMMAMGPLLGTLAMLTLRRLPEATQLASGHR